MSAPELLTVRRPEALAFGLDPQPLFVHGLAQVRAYAGGVWSDHNVHDPGINALEALCYALSDLAYRARFPVEDLLAAPRDNAAAMASELYGARAALTNRPVTVLDYRKLLIDVDGVRNAWVFAHEEPTYYADPVAGELAVEKDPQRPDLREVHLRGLYRARIELADEQATAAQHKAVAARAYEKLMQNRLLGEDFVAVEPIGRQAFLLCAEIEIEPQVDPADAYGRILLAVRQYLSPGVPRHTRADMLNRRKPDGSARTDPELYEGPSLENGFIDDAELEQAELRSQIRLSDVIAIIMDLEGVRAVRDIVIRAEDASDEAGAESKWLVSVEPGKRSVLDAEASRLVLYKGSTPLRSPTAVAAGIARYEALKQADEERYRPRPRPLDDREIPLGRFRDASVYEPLAAHFPAVYGIGEQGLRADASAEREAQAKQFLGYLLFFDQLLANAFAQLGEVRQLFSRDPLIAQTYFGQRVAGRDDLYRAGNAVALEDEAAMLERRNRFLDHLIARFAERLPGDLQVQAALFGLDAAAAARAKCAFLADCATLGGERGLAFDYALAPASDAAAANVSGLEKRLAHLLGLGAVNYEIYQERDADGIDEYRFRLRARYSGRILLSSPLERRFATPEAARAVLMQALDAAKDAAGYRRRQDRTGRFYFVVVDGAGEELAWHDQFFRTAAERDAMIGQVMDAMAAQHAERLCVIENILLRPRPGAADSFLPICADPGCGEGCPGDDPYSYRLHIVLPAGGRFADMAFRRYAEEVIRQETPVHLLPKICWLDDEHLAEVEAAWLDWRGVLAQASDATATKLARLRKALFESKNVYDEPTLGACGSPGQFIVGRTALGSRPRAPQ